MAPEETSTRQKVEERIANWPIEPEGELNLSLLDLSELPESVRGLTGVRKLDLFGNLLTTLPDLAGRMGAGRAPPRA